MSDSAIQNNSQVQNQPSITTGVQAVSSHDTEEVKEFPDEGRPATVVSQALSTALLQSADPLNPASPTSSTKEKNPAFTVDQSAEFASGVQSVESLRTPEIPAEVEKYIEAVQDHPDEIQERTVISGQDLQQLSSANINTITKPVIVLPITEEELQVAQKAPLDSSKRWFSVWVEKIMKMFIGEVVFRDKESK